jgi:outer membrane protein assembly factor BamB
MPFSVGSTGFSDYATVAYSASTGTQLWVMRYSGPGNGWDTAYALGVSPDGSTVLVTGSSAGSTGSSDYATVAYDASTGTQLWVMRYDPGNRIDTATALGVSADGSMVFVTGSSTGSTGFSDYATMAYSTT